MGMFLNNKAPIINYRKMIENPYFVDKSDFISELIRSSYANQYICITRPRRFGKTVMANMLAAFFDKNTNSSNIFDSLKISQYDEYNNHLNKHEVIYIDFSEVPDECSNYKDYITRITTGLKADLIQKYPELGLDTDKAVWDILSEILDKTNGQQFIFIMDEWDAVFHMSFITDNDKDEYLLFLKSLLKSKAYVELAYMTGILPIAKYSSGSELNMFAEFQMTTMEMFCEYFGFTDDEVDDLYSRYLKQQKNPKVSREGIREWYDGYRIASGNRLYNPRSVVFAFQYNQLSDYWTSSGPYDEIFYYIRNNIDDVRDDLALMISGERIETRIQQYAAVSMELNTKSEIYSAMLVYGLLTYENGEVFIPNKELMRKFEELLMKKDSLGYIHNLAKESARMLNATLAGDTKTMENILEYAHDTETPILSYNYESELAAIVNLVYLSARDKYRIEREEKAGKGFVDFIFYPKKKDADCIILELKVDKSPDEAIKQIKEKNYALNFKGNLGENPEYTGRILAVGISYSKDTKSHSCKVQELT